MTSNWPQVSDLKKPELYVIQLGELSTSWKFEGNQSKTVSWTGAKRKLKFDHDLVPVFLTWWPDPRSPGPEIFRSYVKRLPHRLCQIWRRCAPPFLRYLRKTLGGVCIDPPPARARVKLEKKNFFKFYNRPIFQFGGQKLKSFKIPDSGFVAPFFFSTRPDIELRNCLLTVAFVMWAFQDLMFFAHFCSNMTSVWRQ